MKIHSLKLWPAVLTGLLCAAACPASEPPAPILACRALADPAARLACFDRESARLAPAPVTPAPVAVATSPAPVMPAPAAAPAPMPAPAFIPTPAAATLSAAPAPTPASAAPAAPAAAAPMPAANSKENFGLSETAVAQKEVDAGARPKEISSINAHIAAVSHTGAGLATFTLDNGQVWQQLSAEGDLLAKPGEPVTVSRGMFRSYWLQAKSGRGCKVTRIS